MMTSKFANRLRVFNKKPFGEVWRRMASGMCDLVEPELSDFRILSRLTLPHCYPLLEHETSNLIVAVVAYSD